MSSNEIKKISPNDSTMYNFCVANNTVKLNKRIIDLLNINDYKIINNKPELDVKTFFNKYICSHTLEEFKEYISNCDTKEGIFELKLIIDQRPSHIPLNASYHYCSSINENLLISFSADILSDFSNKYMRLLSSSFDTATRAGNIGVWIIDCIEEPDYIWLPDSTANLIGFKTSADKRYKLSDWENNIISTMGEHEFKRVKSVFDDVLSGVKESYYNKFQLTVNGEKRWFNTVSNNIIRNDKNEAAYIPGVVIDITQEIENENKLKSIESEAKVIKEIADLASYHGNVGVWFINFDGEEYKFQGNITKNNMIGLEATSTNSISAKEFTKIISKHNSEEVVSKIVDSFYKTVNGKINAFDITYNCVNNKGESLTLHTQLSNIKHGPDGKVSEMSGITTDVTKYTNAIELAHTDPLTRLSNRLKYNLDYENGLFTDRQVAFIDIDKFKSINDVYGHHVGDLYLQGLANSLLSIDEIYSYRLSGDEFVIVSKEKSSFKKMKEIIDFIPRHIIVKELNADLYLSLSIGIVHNDETFNDLEDLFKYCDKVMYLSKIEGNKTTILDKKLKDKISKELKIEHDLTYGIENNQIVPYYQPIVSLSSGNIVAVETLARWVKNDYVVPAKDFFDTAIKLNLESYIDKLIFKQGSEDYVKLAKKNKDWGKMSFTFNLSDSSLNRIIKSQHFLQAHIDKKGAKIPPKNIIIEISEKSDLSVLSDEFMDYITNIGVNPVLDDYGKGMSNFAYIANSRFSDIKLDMSLLPLSKYDVQETNMFNSFVDMLVKNNKYVVVEGIENEFQYELAKNSGAKLAQGFYISKPLPFDELVRFLEKNHS